MPRRRVREVRKRRRLRYFELVSGANCEVMSCDVNKTACGAYGYCATMSQLAANALFYDEYGEVRRYNYSNVWDADMVRGCQCLNPEGVYHTSGDVHRRNQHLVDSQTYRTPFAFAYSPWTGPTCSQAFCPTGDNPFTPGLNEIQTLNCSLATDGGFDVTFRNSNNSVYARRADMSLMHRGDAAANDVDSPRGDDLAPWRRSECPGTRRRRS